MAAYDTAELATQVKLFGMIPTSQNTFTDAELIGIMMNSILTSDIIELVMSVREEYLVHVEDIVVPALGTLTIPTDASGLRLRDVAMVDTAGNLMNVRRIEPTAITSDGFTDPGGWTGWGPAFYVQNNKLIFYPAQTDQRTVRVSYNRRPNKLVHPSEGGKVLSKVGPDTITLDNAPGTWATNTVLDVIEPTIPFNLVDPDGITVLTKAGFDLTVSPADYAKVDVGDYMATRGEAQFVQYIPVEAYNALAQGTVVQCLLALNDRGGAETANAKYNMMKQSLMTLLTPRVEGEPRKIISRNSAFRAAGYLGGSGAWWR